MTPCVGAAPSGVILNADMCIISGYEVVWHHHHLRWIIGQKHLWEHLMRLTKVNLVTSHIFS